MAEQIKELIAKIQQEGIQVAQTKAKAIEEEANRQAEEILKKAKLEAEKILNAAKERISKMEAASTTSLKQVGRDLLITLRKEINALLEKLLLVRVREALSPQELIKIISALIKECSRQEKGAIIVSLNKADLEKIEKSFWLELKEEAKKGIVLRAQEDISGGFNISFDAGKSGFDFTDKALAEHLGLYLKPALAELFKSS